ncbi:MAG: dihydroorotase family protein [bacterium]|nr:dihydroorotase family protein [Acidimicrobiia bacterium]MCY4651302.1 dihydroorotase family protein [bacterium]
MLDLKIVGATVVSDGRSYPADVGVEGALITEVSVPGSLGPARREIDASGLLVIPGAVDAHFHCRAPSHPERATFASESRAAASSGVTTLFEMPISNPPCSTPEAFAARRELGEAESLVDFALYSGAGITDPARAEAMAESGAIGFKLFTHNPPPERVNEFEGLVASEPGHIYDCLRTVSATGLRCAVHSESQQMMDRFRNDTDRFGNPSRPPMVEAAAVGLVATIARELRIPAHIVHITSRLATEEVKAAQSVGVDLSGESCPHYLLLDDSYIPRFGNFVKVGPPIRPAEDVAYLWDALSDGSLSVVASDHAPFTPEEKAAADFASSGQGIPSLEMLVPTMLDAGLTERFPLERAVEVMTANPAKLFGIYPRKGTVSPGSDADLVLINPQGGLTVDSARFLSRSGGSGKAYDGMELAGRVLTTICGGRIVFDNGKVIGTSGGKFISPDGPPLHVTQTQPA